MSIPVADRKDGADTADLAGTASASKLHKTTHPPLGRHQHPVPHRQRIARFNLGHQQCYPVGVSRRLTILLHSRLRRTVSYIQWV